jgi:IS5 family transposase
MSGERRTEGQGGGVETKKRNSRTRPEVEKELRKLSQEKVEAVIVRKLELLPFHTPFCRARRVIRKKRPTERGKSEQAVSCQLGV